VFFAYFGPETVMPMTSVVATIAAFLMMFGKTIFRYLVAWARVARYRIARASRIHSPHSVVERPVRRRIRPPAMRHEASRT
jgi:hypothetical protein